MNKDGLINLIKSSGFENIGEIDLKKVEYHADLRDMCEMNTCGRYGKTWNCPPVIGSYEKLSSQCKSFSAGLLFSFVSEIEDSFDFEGMSEAGSELCRKLCKVNIGMQDIADTQNNDSKQKINNEQVDEKIVAYQLYGSGACFSCEKCTYPDEPCRYPEMCFIPIEAAGIYVTQLAKDSGLKYNNGVNTVTFFGMLLFQTK